MSDVEKYIEKLEDEISRAEEEIYYQDGRIKVIKSKLCKSIDSVYINKFIKSETSIAEAALRGEISAVDSESVNKLSEQFPALYEVVDPIQQKASEEQKLESLKYELKAAKAEQKKAVAEEKKAAKAEAAKQKSEELEKKDNGSWDGHLYPIKAVVWCTEKLKKYNKMMDDFLADIDKISPECDITWLVKKIEKFCRKINYYLALARYEIIKALSKAYRQANKFSEIIEPVVNFVKPALSANPADLLKGLTSVITWITKVILMFMGPYKIIIQFIQDFMTYTPPLVDEATSLVSKTASIPKHLLGILDRAIENTTVTNDNGEKQAIVDVYKDYINIKMEKITLADIMGSPPEKPTYATANMTAKQKEVYESRVNAYESELDVAWNDLVGYIKSCANSSGEYWATDSEKLTRLYRNLKWYTYSEGRVTTTPDTDCFTADEVAKFVFGEKNYLLKDIYSQKIRSSFKVYAMYNTQDLANSLENLHADVYNYYFYLYGNNTGRGAQKALALSAGTIAFIKSYSGVMPDIPKYLNQFGDKMKEAADAIKKMQDIDKPSVFD